MRRRKERSVHREKSDTPASVSQQRQQSAFQSKDRYLLIDGIPLSKDKPSTNQSGEEGVRFPLFPTAQRLLQQQRSLVDGHEASEVEGVLLRSAVDVVCTRLPADGVQRDEEKLVLQHEIEQESWRDDAPS